MRYDLVLYLGVLVTLLYLIYRYARYSKWEATDAGRAFMGMKVCLLSLVGFVLWARAFPEAPVRELVRALVVGSIWLALTYQVHVVVKRQGGLRRDKPVEHWVPYHSEEPRRKEPK